MPKDLSALRQDGEQALAAIAALKAKGSPITAYTVASEAQLSRSAIYRNPELVNLIDAESGVPSSASDMTNDDQLKRISELVERCRELEETIWNLEQQNESLGKANQDAYRLGYEAGINEASQRFSQPNQVLPRSSQSKPAPVPAHRPSNAAGMAKPPAEPARDRMPAEITGDFQPLSSKNLSDGDYIFNGLLNESPAKRTNGEPAITASQDEPAKPASGRSNGGRATEPKLAAAAVSQPAQVEAEPAVRDANGILNLVRSGPISSSDFNPIVELSWTDLENVYNFRFASLSDYSTAAQSALYAENVDGKLAQFPQADPTFKGAHTVQLRDQRQTGDHLLAQSDPRNLSHTEPVVDLDALDIFDDFDLTDSGTAAAQSATEQEAVEMSGDDLRELIKGRIKQAADIPQDQAIPRMTAPPPQEGDAGAKAGPRNKFVGSKAAQEPVVPAHPIVRSIPPEIRKACMILGIKPEDITQKLVYEAWKKQIAAPGVHPDLGGDTEAAIFLNTAKDTLVRWIDKQAPKLGKKFGGKPQSTQTRMPSSQPASDK